MNRKLLTLLLVFGLLGLTESAHASPATITSKIPAQSLVDSPPVLGFTAIASGLSSPVAITNAGDGSGRLFITLQGGQIVIYDGAQILPTPFLDISSLVDYGGERGLLSAAFHPHYASNGTFYVDYTRASDGAIVIARYHVSADPNIADPNSAAILLVIPHPSAANHNGGQLQFGPDGYLYIGNGDGGTGGSNAQNGTSLLGKILRIDVDSGSPYAIPSNNPFVSDPTVADEVWALGLRNPWRFSFDRLTSDLLIGDVGQNTWEEIDFQSASSLGGQNYGWPCYEGNHPYSNSTSCVKGILTYPILEYNHGASDSNGCAVIGGYRYRGSDYPALYGVYLYSDVCSGKIWGAAPNSDGSWTSVELVDTNYSVTAFGQDERGELYLTDYYAGTIYKISASGFADVPPSYWAWSWIERLYLDGITAGCATNPLRYCPADPVTRDQMAVFLLRSLHGSSYSPPAATGVFADVPANYWAAAWIEELYAEGITAGCSTSPLLYCPGEPVTRDQMAVFLLRAAHGTGFTPPAATGIFTDVPATYWAANWIEELYAEAVTGGCNASPLQYCPTAPVTRDQMAVFLIKMFSLP